MSTPWKILIGAFIGLIIGFYLGRMNTKTTVKTEYIKGDPITIYVDAPEPVSEVVPSNPILPMKSDTIYIDNNISVYQSVDSAAIIAEYIIKRNYVEVLFDDKNGKFTAEVEVQYNKLQHIKGIFVPIQKVVTIEKEKVFTPFILGSYNSVGGMGVGAGIFYHNLGIGAQYITDIDKNSVGVVVMYKF